MLKVVIMPAARREIIDARNWYNGEVNGLGARFVDELDHQIERIITGPDQFPVMEADVRRARLRHFPYGLFFRQIEQTIYVLACFHSSRNPAIWRGRT